MSEYGILVPVLDRLRRCAVPAMEFGSTKTGQISRSPSHTTRYDANGVFVGSNKITAALVLGASGDEFTTSSTIEIFDANDNLVGTGCATAAGTRFE